MILKRLYACALCASERSLSDTGDSVIIRHLPRQETNSLLFLISIPDHPYNSQDLIIKWAVCNLTIIWVIKVRRMNSGAAGGIWSSRTLRLIQSPQKVVLTGEY